MTDPRAAVWQDGAASPEAALLDGADAVEALRRSERRFRSLIENASDLITIIDGTGIIRYESPSVARMLGYDPAERLERSFFDFVHGQDLPDVLLLFTRALAHPGDNIALQLRCMHRDSGWRILEGTAKNLLEDPAVAGVVLNMREITDRKRVEEAQARLTAVMDSTPDLVCTLDPHGRINYMNRAGRRMMGIGPLTDTTRLNLNDLHPAWANEMILNRGLPAAMRDGVWSGESALVRHDGREVPVLQVILAHRAEDGSVQFFSTTARDISERKLAEEALRQSDEVLRQIAENISEALWIYDVVNGRPVYVSAAYERIWGRPVEEAYRDASALLASLGPAAIAGAAEAKDGAPAEVETLVQHPDGSRRWLRSHVVEVRDGAGGVVRIVGITEDVTERKRMELELHRVQRLEAIGHLAGGIAHEINTPIQYISDNIRFINDSVVGLLTYVARHESALAALAGGESPKSLTAQLSAARDELDIDYLADSLPEATTHSLDGMAHIAEIVRAMKAFSLPAAAVKVVHDLNQAILNTVTIARNEWKHVAEVTTDLEPLLPPVTCLAAEVNQMILSLLLNAKDAIAEAVRADGEHPAIIRITTRRVGEWVEIGVSDTGTGIPEAIRSRIFDPFFTTKEVGAGIGQGLAVAHATVVEKHGGTIAFTTELGAGTTFTVRLPLGTGGAEGSSS